MSLRDLRTHVFRIYGELVGRLRFLYISDHLRHGRSVDDDHNGTLDAAECDSLFRLLYNTNELSPQIKKVLKDVDANGDGLLSLGAQDLSIKRDPNNSFIYGQMNSCSFVNKTKLFFSQ